jgi:hypothetical protein
VGDGGFIPATCRDMSMGAGAGDHLETDVLPVNESAKKILDYLEDRRII